MLSTINHPPFFLLTPFLGGFLEIKYGKTKNILLKPTFSFLEMAVFKLATFLRRQTVGEAFSRHTLLSAEK